MTIYQVSENFLSSNDLETRANEVVRRLRTENQKLKTVFLINSRADIARASGGQGVHLRSNDISPSEVKKIWPQGGGTPARVTVGVSCHTRSEVGRAAQSGADFAVFGPVFEKGKASTRLTGLDALREACQEQIPVIALGGINLENPHGCIRAGAAGIAAIRLFQQGEMHEAVAALRRFE